MASRAARACGLVGRTNAPRDLPLTEPVACDGQLGTLNGSTTGGSAVIGAVFWEHEEFDASPFNTSIFDEKTASA